MIIDFHTHTFPDKIAAATIEKLSLAAHAAPHCNGTEDGLKASMVQAGIDLSIILPVATNAAKVSRVNDASLHLDGTNGLLSFGCMHPEYSDWHAELGRIAAAGMKGIKLHPVYQGVDFDDVRYLRILDRCGELGLIVLTHAGQDIAFPSIVHCSPEMIRRAVRAVGPVKLILAHMGGWRDWAEVEDVLPETGVYVDTAFCTGTITPRAGDETLKELQMLDAETFVRMVRAFGAEKVVFGSDSPWGDQKETVAWIQALPLTEEEKQLIFSGNAKQLLGL